MLDRVLDQRLEKHRGDHHIQRLRIEFLHNPQLVASKADDLNIEVVVDELYLLAQRNERIRAVQQPPEDGRQLDDEFAGGVGIEPDQRGDRIQRVEEKMRIDLVLEGFHAGLQQEPFLLFQFYLDPHSTENLQLGSDHHDGGGIDRHLNPPVRTLQREGRPREVVRQFAMHEPQGHDRDEKHDLPVKQSWLGQVAADPTIKAQIDKRRKRPDIFLVGRVPSQLSGDEPAQNVKGHGRPFAMQQGRKCDQAPAQHTRQTTANHAQQQGCLKRQISGKKAFLNETNPDPQRDGNAEPKHQVNLLRGATLLAEQKFPELERPDQGA